MMRVELDAYDRENQEDGVKVYLTTDNDKIVIEIDGGDTSEYVCVELSAKQLKIAMEMLT